MGRRNDLGTAWWSRQWLGALETRALRDPNRLPRGRTYARHGYVFDLVIAEGEITAKVQGSRAQPYRVTIGIRRFRPEEWDTVFTVIASQLGFAAELLGGNVPHDLIADAAGRGVDLLPAAGDLTMHCSCPDWAVPCKHLAAACYLTASALDDDPFQLLLLRGRSRTEINARLRSERSEAAGATTTAGDTLELATDLWNSTTVGDDASIPVFNVIGRRHPSNAPWTPHLGARWEEIADHTALAHDVADAAARADAALLDGSDSAATLDRSCDAARRAADTAPVPLTAAARRLLAERCAMSVRLLESLANSWTATGADGVAITLSLNAEAGGHTTDANWPPIDATLARLAREVLADEGVRFRVSERWLTVVGAKRRIIAGTDDRWWAVEKRHGAWRVSGSAVLEDLADLCR